MAYLRRLIQIPGPTLSSNIAIKIYAIIRHCRIISSGELAQRESRRFTCVLSRVRSSHSPLIAVCMDCFFFFRREDTFHLCMYDFFFQILRTTSFLKRFGSVAIKKITAPITLVTTHRKRIDFNGMISIISPPR